MEPAPDSTPEPEASPTRRGFLGFLTVALGSVPILGGVFATMRAGLAPAHAEKPGKIRLCDLEDVPTEGVKQVAVSYSIRQGPVRESVAKVVFVTRDPNAKNEVIAMDGTCTHLACPVQSREIEYSKGKKAPLTCPCHDGMFSQTGEVLAGPPRGPLLRLSIEVPKEKSGPIYLLET